MKTRLIGVITRDLRWVVAILILLLATPPAIDLARAAGTDDAARSGEDAAVKQVVAGFSDGWNGHDARAMCASLAEDVHWVNWRGEASGSRKEVEQEHASFRRPLQEHASYRHREVYELPRPRTGFGRRLLDHDWRAHARRRRYAVPAQGTPTS